jgi:hypothetical protein
MVNRTGNVKSAVGALRISLHRWNMAKLTSFRELLKRKLKQATIEL